MSNSNFNSVLIIGVGLIGSSIARAMREKNLVKYIYGLDNDLGNLNKCKDLNILSEVSNNLNNYSEQFDMIIICSPLSTYKKIFSDLNSYVVKDTLITDVGSTKMSTIKDFQEVVTNQKLLFVPSHPIAGLEKSGPEYGFSELFSNRFCIITPFKSDRKTIFRNTTKKIIHR